MPTVLAVDAGGVVSLDFSSLSFSSSSFLIDGIPSQRVIKTTTTTLIYPGLQLNRVKAVSVR